MPLRHLSHVKIVPLVPPRMPRQRRPSALVYHVREDPTHRQVVIIIAPSALQELTSHSKGLAARRAAYHAQEAPIVAPQELHLLAPAMYAQQAHTLHLLLLRALPATPAVGLSQTPLSVQTVKPAPTIVSQDLRVLTPVLAALLARTQKPLGQPQSTAATAVLLTHSLTRLEPRRA